MCGIAGITKAFPKKDYDAVSNSLKKRGPDGRGVWTQNNVTFFHSRLSIIDTLARSNQPMVDNSGRYVIVYNGEIFNYKELRKQFASKYNFKTTSDTEVILAGYILYGHEIWSMLSGMFALALYDLEKNKIVLARDHAGIKPFFYSYKDQELYFGSTIRSIFALMPEISADSSIDLVQLREYFVLGYVPSPKTIFKHIGVFPKSHYGEYDIKSRKFKIERYSPIQYDTRDTLHNDLTKAVIEHLESDVPVGLFFSGGVDSSLIAAILEANKKNLQTFSLKVPGRSEDEEFSKKIAAHLGINVNQTVFDQAAFDTSYSAIRECLDVPLADVALFTSYYISNIASKDLKVVLSGEGGDELFYGYKRHIALRHNHRHCQRLLRYYLAFPNHRGKGRLFGVMAKQVNGAAYYISQCSPSITTLGQSEYKSIHSKLEVLPDLITIDKEFYLENMLLRKLDLVTMSNSIEGRVPLLSPRLCPHSNAINKDTIESEANSKYNLKEILRSYIPSEYVDRKKTGFGFHPETFMRANEQLYDDYRESYLFLSELGIPFTKYSSETVWKHRPGLALAATLLYRSIKNQVL